MPQPRGKLKNIVDKILNRPKDKERKKENEGGIIPVPSRYQ